MPVQPHVQALSLLEGGVTVSRIMEYTSISKATIYRIRKIVYGRGHDPKAQPCARREAARSEPATADRLTRIWWGDA
jgi:hypothetical protein